MESIRRVWNGGVRSLFFDVNNVKDMMLTQEELEKVVADKGNLSGATLAPEVDVKGLRFDFVKMDAAMLCLLVKTGADVRGADLSYQDFRGVELDDVDLSHVICTQTDFGSAKFNKVTLIGVKLHTAADVPCPFISSVIFSEDDRMFYIERDKNRLLFVLNSENSYCINDSDPFFTLPDSVIQDLRIRILHPVDADWLDHFIPSHSSTAQGLVLNGQFDGRCAQGSEAKIEEASEKLLGTDFNDAQKTLFHHARAALWALWDFNDSMAREHKITQIEVEKEMRLRQLYFPSGNGGPRFGLQLAEAVFTSVFPYSTYEYALTLTDEQITAVRELFLSPDYVW